MRRSVRIILLVTVVIVSGILIFDFVRIRNGHEVTLVGSERFAQISELKDTDGVTTLRIYLPLWSLDLLQSPESWEIVKRAPSMLASVDFNESLGHFVSRRFHFTQEQSPRLFVVLALEIVSRNKLPLAIDQILPVGAILIPAFAGINNAQPGESRVAIDSAVVFGDLKSERIALDSEWVRRIDTSGTGIFLSFRLPSSRARTLIANGLRVEDVSTFVTLDYTPGTDPRLESLGLTLAQRESIRDAASRPTARNVILVILDSGWPSKDAFDRSLGFILPRLRNLWNVYEFGQFQDPHLKWKEPSLQSGDNFHAAQIDSALSDFVALDGTRRIPIVYLPLTTGQDAVQLIQRLVHTYHMLLQRSLNPASAKLSPSTIRNLKRVADDVVRSIPTRDDANGKAFTNSSVIGAALAVLQAIAALDNSLVVINTSWTADDGVLDPIGTGGKMNELVVAAAGNQKDVNLDAQGWDFAKRSASGGGTYITVLNTTRSGVTQCSSSIVTDDSETLKGRLVVGYNGDVGSSTCATSFAAPRVGWLLALYLSNLPQGKNWPRSLLDRIEKLRKGNDKLAAIHLDIEALLSP